MVGGGSVVGVERGVVKCGLACLASALLLLPDAFMLVSDSCGLVVCLT